MPPPWTGLGLPQAQLAARSGTSRSAIARYERARALPSLYRLVRACGLGLRMHLEPYAGDPAALIGDAPARSVEDRLRTNDDFSRLAAQLRHGSEVGDA